MRVCLSDSNNAPIAGAILVLFGVVQPAAAQSLESEPRRNFIALGAAVGPDYLGSDDFSVLPFLAGRYDAQFAAFELRGPSLSADFFSHRTGGAFSAGPLVRYRFGRDDVDNDAVDRLETVDDAIEIGGFVGYNVFGLADARDRLSLRMEASFDVSDGHEGFVITPSVAYSTPVTERLRLTATASTAYGDENFNSAFFDIDAAGSAASGLDTFTADAGFYQAGLSLAGTYTITRRWGVTGLVSYNRFLGDAADSPVADDEGDANQFFFGLGALYRF